MKKVKRNDYMDENGGIHLNPIGVVHSPLTEESDVLPFQSLTSDVKGTIEVFKEYEKGLDEIEKFSHIFIIFYLHKSENTKLKTVPLMEEEERGIFATRSPSRPNHIGCSTVRLLAHRNQFLDVEGLDIFDGTPVIDIKPYVAEVDIIKDVDTSWLKEKLEKTGRKG